MCCILAQKIKKLENVYKIYQKQLLEEGTVKQEDLKKLQEHVSGIMSDEFEAARSYKPEARTPLHPWPVQLMSVTQLVSLHISSHLR